MEKHSSSTDTFQKLLKTFLKETYLLTDEFEKFGIDKFANKLNRTEEESLALLSVLKGLHMIKSVPESENHFKITSGGINNLKIVLTGGVFDIIHLGHLKTLNEAKKYGDILIVVVASDQTVKLNKGRPPINSQENRIKLLSHIDLVDIVVAGDPNPEKLIEIVIKYHPDIIVLGYDQSLTETRLAKLLTDNNLLNTEIVRLGSHIPNEKSSLKVKDLDEYSFD